MKPEEMEERMLINFRNYGATTCIYLLIDKNYLQQEKGINVWGMYDSGSVIQNIMLLAVNYGLGTIAQAMAVVYPDIIHKELGIPQDKLVALGIAIGYPDWDNEINKDFRDREPLDTMAKFYGF
jgi:nitroreductase